MKIAIVAVGYNRKESISRLLASLNNGNYLGESITLVISIDKSNTSVVETFADSFEWKHGEKIVDKHEKNLGLREHMLSLTKWFDLFDVLIVLEDDIIVAPTFYSFVVQTTQKYFNDENIAGISLYSFFVNYQNSELFVPYKNEYDTYFMNCAMSWGQVWMKKQWLSFVDWYKEHLDFVNLDHLPKAICEWPKSSWLKYHTRYCIEQNKFFVYPYYGYSTNCGAVGTHNKKTDSSYQVPMQMGNIKTLKLPDFGDEAVYYDGFFENTALYSHLGYSPQDCCIDLNGCKCNREGKQYWLTTHCMNYKIEKSFGLDFRPIELNIMMNNKGRDIFLYNTKIAEKQRFSNDYARILLYKYYLSSVITFLKKYGFVNLIRAFFEKIFSKFK